MSKRSKRKWKWWVLFFVKKENKQSRQKAHLTPHSFPYLFIHTCLCGLKFIHIHREKRLFNLCDEGAKFLHNVRVSPTCLCLQTPKWSRDFRDVIIIGCPREGCDWLVSTVTSHPLFLDQWEHSIKFTPIIPLRHTSSCKIYINLYIMHYGCLYIHLDVLLDK